MKKASAGFTLIELVIVIVILGILAATALPRFLDVSDGAHKAAVESAQGSLQAGVTLARAKWYTSGQEDTIAVGGQTDIAMEDGWISDCAKVWPAVMQRPALGEEWTAAAEHPTDGCEFIYRAESSNQAKLIYYYSGPKAGSVEIAD